MAQLTILEFPDPRLRTRAAPVQVFDVALEHLIEDMFETMYAAPGIGLAATQVNMHQRLIVIDVSETRDERQIERAERITVRAQDARGEFFEREAEGLLAICLQHEIDHIEGKLFVDRLSSLKRDHIRRRIEKERHERESMPPGRTRRHVPAASGAKVI